jgi:hypothetical protein
VLRGLSGVYGWPGFQPKTKAVAEIDPALYARYEGRYRYTEAPEWGAVVFREGDRLLWEDIPGGPCYVLYPESATAFFTLERGQRITFIREPDGSVETVRVGGHERLERAG